jgi:lysozyme family protein
MFEKIIKLVLKSEGGYTNHPSDPGGITNRGITLKFLKGTNDLALGDLDKDGDIDEHDIRILTEDQAVAIYKRHVWDANGVDKFEDCPKLQYVLFDTIVNSGPSRGYKILQEAIGGLTVDGAFGPKSFQAYNNISDKDALVERYLEKRKEFYNIIIANKPQLEAFRRGWYNRLNDIRQNFAIL